MRVMEIESGRKSESWSSSEGSRGEERRMCLRESDVRRKGEKWEREVRTE